MRAALAGGHVVDEGIDVFRVGIRILDGHAQKRALAPALEGDGVGDGLLVRIEVLHEVGKAAFIAVLAAAARLVLFPLVGKDEAHALIEVGQFAHAAAHGVAVEVCVLEHARVGLEADLRAALAGVAHLFQGRDGVAGDDLAGLSVLIGLEADVVVAVIAVHVHRHPLGEGVDHGRAHAVQAAGIGIVLVVELAAGVQLRIDDLHAGDAQLRMDVHRNAAAVVRHLAGAVLFQRHGDLGGEAVGSLVDGVIDDLPDEVVQPARAGGADVHARAHAHRVEALEYLYVGGGIGLCHGVPPNKSATIIQHGR